MWANIDVSVSSTHMDLNIHEVMFWTVLFRVLIPMHIGFLGIPTGIYAVHIVWHECIFAAGTV